MALFGFGKMKEEKGNYRADVESASGQDASKETAEHASVKVLGSGCANDELEATRQPRCELGWTQPWSM
jgi:hypothetical protein